MFTHEMEGSFIEDGLRAVHDLTPAEAKLRRLRLPAIRSRQPRTRSSTAKERFAKTGEGRQPDLVRRLLSDPALRMIG